MDEYYDPLGWLWKSEIRATGTNGVEARHARLTTMSELKPLSKEAIPAALEKAERYRLLNEPAEAESICLDILAPDPENQQALIILLLASPTDSAKATG